MLPTRLQLFKAELHACQPHLSLEQLQLIAPGEWEELDPEIKKEIKKEVCTAHAQFANPTQRPTAIVAAWPKLNLVSCWPSRRARGAMHMMPGSRNGGPKRCVTSYWPTTAHVDIGQ
jgi:hypothetical protein